MINETMWEGEFVETALHLRTPPPSKSGLQFEDIAGLALRKNPKRAHLIVSKLLGKHYPQSPYLIQAAAMILANMVKASINQVVYDEENTALSLLKEALTDSDIAETLYGYLQGSSAQQRMNPVVCFGYAETATGLGAGIADHMEANYYLHSTRYPSPLIPGYGFFEEEHSHATQHHITPEDPSYLNNEHSVIVLVDDELTTGTTIMNTIRMIEQGVHHKEYAVATLIDSRSTDAVDRMNQFAARYSIKLHIHSLFAGHLDVPANALAAAAPVVLSLAAGQGPQQWELPGTAEIKHVNEPLRINELKNGTTEFYSYHKQAQSVASALAPHINGNTLILGVEEDMYFALLVGAELGSTGIKYSTTTRSPALALDEPGYALKDIIGYQANHTGYTAEENIRFSYNVGNEFDTIIVLGTTEEQNSWGTLLQELAKRTKKIIVGDFE